MNAALHAGNDGAPYRAPDRHEPAGRRLAEGLHIAVDVGGTFTDLVLASRAGGIDVFKVPTVPSDPAQGVLAALEKAASARGVAVPALLGLCSLFIHGSTVATNTLLEGKGAKVGCLVTKGFRDSLEVRRGIREDPWSHRLPYPPVLVPRYLRLPIGGRIDRSGAESEALDEADVRRAAEIFAAEGVEAVAICLFNSYLNPDHERAAEKGLRACWSGEWISRSSDIAPVMGEYERTSTAVLNAYVAPRTVSYLRKLDRQLAQLGLPSPMLLIQNNGGAVSVEQIADRPVMLLLSGPAAASGALALYSKMIGSQNLISMEIGGTSCDVALMSGGRVGHADHLEISSYHAAVPSVEIHTVGAGGGTIAGLDGAGLLMVGPQGAGAHPGPACYGYGSVTPTVTDALVVLGRLSAATYAGGAVTIDEALAHRAIERMIAAPLGISRDEAAVGIILLMEQKLLHAVQQISIQRGHDPRRFALIACGGAGALHGAAVARKLNCPTLYVPRIAGAFCALGMLNSDVRHDYSLAHADAIENVDIDRMAEQFAALDRRARKTLEKEGFSDEDMALVRFASLRYSGQQWTLKIAFENGELDVATLRENYRAEYQRMFGHVQENGEIQISSLHVAGVGRLPPLELAAAAPATGPAVPLDHRYVWVDEKIGRANVPIYRGSDLHPGHLVAGPALINEKTTTVFVGAGDRLEVDPASNFRIFISS